MIRTNIYLAAAMLADLRAMAERDGISVAEHVRRAVSEYARKGGYAERLASAERMLRDPYLRQIDAERETVLRSKNKV